MKLVTFNIRCDYAQDGNNCFLYRKELIAPTIKEEAPDLICFQEVLPHVAAWIKESFPEYDLLGCGRDRHLSTEQMCIAVRKERFQIISMDTFWLSPTPYLPGSRYPEQSDCPRTVTEVFLQELSTGRLFDVFNTHLDHISSHARVCGMKQILSHMRDLSEKRAGFGPVIQFLAGDFNALPDAAEIAMLTGSGFLCDLTAALPGTFHDYGKLEIPEKIDYIAASHGIRPVSVSRWLTCKDGVYLSDHFPVCAEFILKADKTPTSIGGE